jgi:hypothetical protein
MRDAGVSVVSSYVFWGLFEPRAGEFDFTGPNDIRRVAELCAKLGLPFAPRIGPFNNSEYLLSGLTPWLCGMPLVERSNNASIRPDQEGEADWSEAEHLRGVPNEYEHEEAEPAGPAVRDEVGADACGEQVRGDQKHGRDAPLEAAAGPDQVEQDVGRHVAPQKVAGADACRPEQLQHDQASHQTCFSVEEAEHR